MSVFQEKDITEINLSFLYVSINNELESVKNEKINLSTPNFISKEQLIYIIKKNIVSNDIKYHLMSMVLYNLDINEKDLAKYIDSPDESDYLSYYKTIDDVKLKKTLNIFDDLNTLYIIFYRQKPSQNHTKRIYISNLKKTIKKRYKDIA